MILLDVIEEHLEEADFLCQQRKNALSERGYNLGLLTELEERLQAHLEGLILAEADVWNLLKPKLFEGERGEAFAAAFVALASGESGYRDDLTKALDQAEGPVLEGIREALRHSTSVEVEAILRSRLGAAHGRIRAIALDVLSFRRSPIDVKQLELFLLYEDPAMVAAAATAVGRLRVRPLMTRLEGLLGSDNPHVRREAMRAALLVGSEKALAHCRTAIRKKGEESSEALTFIGLVGQSEDARLLVEALNQPELARSAVSALGWFGYTSAIDALLPLAADAKLSRLVGEAIARITGLNLEKEQLVATAPAPSTPKAVADSKPQEGGVEEDEFVEGPDEGLPMPDPAKLASWWRANSSRFDKATRYRNGQLYRQQVLIDILHNGNLPDRHLAAIELALLDPACPLLETHALADRQRHDFVKLREYARSN